MTRREILSLVGSIVLGGKKKNAKQCLLQRIDGNYYLTLAGSEASIRINYGRNLADAEEMIHNYMTMDQT